MPLCGVGANFVRTGARTAECEPDSEEEDAVAMERITAVMLLGGLRRSALEVAAGLRPACLPLDAESTLFGAWAGLLSRAGCASLRVITSGALGDDDVDREIDAARIRFPALSITHSVEPSSHRGTGGLLRDAVADLPFSEFVLSVEPHCAPPTTLRPLLDAAATAPMAVGISADDAPAGACLIRVELLEQAPRIGYHDFKEQFVPLMVTKGVRVAPAALSSPGTRVHDLRRYLSAVAWWASMDGPRVHPAAEVDPSARISGTSIVMPEARVGPEAIVHDSVILANAAVGERSVVARSLVPRGFRVAPRSLTVDRILDEETSDAADEVLALGLGVRSARDSRVPTGGRR